MSIVTVSFEHVWLSVFRGVSWLSPFRAVCMQALHQLSRLKFWELSFSTILRLHRHSSVSSSIPDRMPASLPSASRPNTIASKSGMVEAESSRDSGSTSNAIRSTWGHRDSDLSFPVLHFLLLHATPGSSTIPNSFGPVGIAKVRPFV